MEGQNPYQTNNNSANPVNNPPISASHMNPQIGITKQNEIIDRLNRELAELKKNLQQEWHEESFFYQENTNQMAVLKFHFEVQSYEDFRRKEQMLYNANFRSEMEDRNCNDCCYRYNCDSEQAAYGRACRGGRCECFCRGIRCVLLNIFCCPCLSLNSCCTACCGDKLRPTVSGELKIVYGKYKRELVML